MVAAATPAMAAEPVGTIQSAGGATAVADSYIVVFKDSAVSSSGVGDTANRLVDRHGGAVARTYHAALRGFEVKVGAKAAARMAADPAVAYVEQNHTVSIAGTQSPTPSWGLDRVDQRALPLNNSYTNPNTASNVRAYIIDTGNRTTHSDFGGRATWGRNTVDTNNTDCHGHGTHVAGTVGGSSYGLARASSSSRSRCSTARAWDQRRRHLRRRLGDANAIKPAVASMSLGGANSTVDTAVHNSINSGVTYGLAAGNVGADACNTSSRATGASPSADHQPTPGRRSQHRYLPGHSRPARRSSAWNTRTPAPTRSAVRRWPPRTWSARRHWSPAPTRRGRRSRSVTTWSTTPPATW
jgi:subtilisin family serine protease